MRTATVAIGNPYSARTVVGENYSRQVSLPCDVLIDQDVSRGDKIPARYHPAESYIELFADDYGMQLKLVSVGASTGVTIPAAIRDRHDIECGDTLFVTYHGDTAHVRLPEQ